MNRSLLAPLGLVASALAPPALAQSNVSPSNKLSWSENAGWMNWADAGVPAGAQGAHIGPTFLTGFIWCENIGWINLGNGAPANGLSYANTTGADFGVNLDASGNLSGLAWGENVGWINFAGGAMAVPPNPARLDHGQARLRGYAWGENIGWVNLDDSTSYVAVTGLCGTADFDCDGDIGTDADIEAFFACLAGTCPGAPCASTADFDGDGDIGTDADIEAFFRVLAGGAC
jgi:hypothetical protein